MVLCSTYHMLGRAMCHDGRKNVFQKVKIVLKLQVEQEREEGNRVASVSEQSSLWPQSVPGWEPSCERLPPASWAVVESGVGMMALCCAAWCCLCYYCYVCSVVGKMCRSIIFSS